MITKFVLVVFIGFGNSQTIAIDHFDTSAECEAVRKAVLTVSQRQADWHVCVPYTFSAEQ